MRAARHPNLNRHQRGRSQRPPPSPPRLTVFALYLLLSALACDWTWEVVDLPNELVAGLVLAGPFLLLVGGHSHPRLRSNARNTLGENPCLRNRGLHLRYTDRTCAGDVWRFRAILSDVPIRYSALGLLASSAYAPGSNRTGVQNCVASQSCSRVWGPQSRCRQSSTGPAGSNRGWRLDGRSRSSRSSRTSGI